MPNENFQEESKKTLLMLKMELKKLENQLEEFSKKNSLFEEHLELLSAHFAVFKELAGNVEKSLQEAVKNTSQEWTKESLQKIDSGFSKLLGTNLEKLERALTRAEKELHKAHKSTHWRLFLAAGAFSLGSLLAGIGSAYFFPRTIEREFFLSPEIMKTYQLGRKVQEKLKNLTKEEREKMKKVLKF